MADANPEYYRRGKIEVVDFIKDQELPYHFNSEQAALLVVYFSWTSTMSTFWNPRGNLLPLRPRSPR